jgi:hypothetical protein
MGGGKLVGAGAGKAAPQAEKGGRGWFGSGEGSGAARWLCTRGVELGKYSGLAVAILCFQISTIEELMQMEQHKK